MGPRLVASLFVVTLTLASLPRADGAELKKLTYPKRARAVAKGPSERPDPPALVSARHYRLHLAWAKGAPAVAEVNVVDLKAAEAVPHWAGRFALELYARGVLIERVRFNFPMMAGAPKGATAMGKAIDEHLVTSTEILFPSVPNGDRFELCDRETGGRYALQWPPSPVVVAQEKAPKEPVRSH